MKTLIVSLFLGVSLTACHTDTHTHTHGFMYDASFSISENQPYPYVPSAGCHIQTLFEHYGTYVDMKYSMIVNGNQELVPEDGKVYLFHHDGLNIYAIVDYNGNCRTAMINRAAQFPIGNNEFENIAKSNNCQHRMAVNQFVSNNGLRFVVQTAPCEIWISSKESVDSSGHFKYNRFIHN